jgi:hypothetical protein
MVDREEVFIIGKISAGKPTGNPVRHEAMAMAPVLWPARIPLANPLCGQANEKGVREFGRVAALPGACSKFLH